MKAELVRQHVNPTCIHPTINESRGEFSLAGFFKKKDQDVCVVPRTIRPQEEILTLPSMLYGQEDQYGFDFTQKTLSVNVRSQLSSSAKNFDTLYERTFAEALNLHLRCPSMVLGELYMIAVKEYDSDSANNKEVAYKATSNQIAKHIEKYLLSFEALNNRTTVSNEHFKYEKVCLLIVDFSQRTPKIYHTDTELQTDGLLPNNSSASIQNLSFGSFISTLLDVYSQRFGAGMFR